MPHGSAVACIAAPRNDHAKPDSPWRSLHGEKWSEDIAGVEARGLRLLRVAQQPAGRDLLVRAVQADRGWHDGSYPVCGASTTSRP